MKEIALEFINIIEDSGYKAYIVGGFVRDSLMGKQSKDIDITTSATPKQIKEIFKNVKSSKDVNDENSYGSVRVIYKNTQFEVTTFRQELDYLDNRHPSSVLYVNNLETDLKRRDFTINAICYDKFGNLVDPINGRVDLENKVIKTIGDSKKSFKDDALRILRAIRFKTILEFELDEEVIEAIKVSKEYLKNISYERKKLELDKIFASLNAKSGLELIKKLELIDVLELNNFERVKDYTDLIGIWAMLNPKNYKFTKPEKELIKKVNIVFELDNLNPLVLYKYGLYVNILAGINKGIKKREIIKKYNDLPIKSRGEILITAHEICEILEIKPNSLVSDIYNFLEIEILNGNLENDNLKLKEYILKFKK